MEFEAFMKSFGPRIETYISKFRRAFKLPFDFTDDLRQVCHLAIWKNLPYWRPDLGNASDGSKIESLSAFNWCAGPMRRAMEAAAKSHIGAKPYSGDSLSETMTAISFTELTNTHAVDSSMAHLEETIDLKRLLQADPKPQHVVRFIATALSPASGADIARAHGISRQAVCISVSKTRKRLRSAWG